MIKIVNKQSNICKVLNEFFIPKYGNYVNFLQSYTPIFSYDFPKNNVF